MSVASGFANEGLKGGVHETCANLQMLKTIANTSVRPTSAFRELKCHFLRIVDIQVAALRIERKSESRPRPVHGRQGAPSLQDSRRLRPN